MAKKPMDLSGKIFGDLVAIHIDYIGDKRGWLCKCICGNEVTYTTSSLNSGKVVSCGCSKDRKYSLLGKKFGMLTVVGKADNLKKGRPRWLCKCDCGNEKILESKYLNSGSSTHCGCMSFDNMSKAKRGRYGESLRNKIFSSYKSNARHKNISFELSAEQVFKIFKEDCYYCGVKPSKVVKKEGFYGEYVYNGIDRLDSSKGYYAENVVPCCESCNYMKNSIHHDDFMDKIERIYLNHNSEKR